MSLYVSHEEHIDNFPARKMYVLLGFVSIERTMKDCQRLLIPLLKSLCSSIVGARTDLPLTIPVEVLPLFERFFLSKAEQSQGLLFSPFVLFFLC